MQLNYTIESTNRATLSGYPVFLFGAVIATAPQQTEFVSETAPEQGQIPQPVHYNENTDGEQNPANPYQTGFEQQTANSSNGQFDAQQFTYQPQNNAPAGKKPMSNGKITEYDNDYDYDSKTVTVEVPSKIDGKDVVEIESLKVYNLTDYDNDDVFIKVIIPGSVKVIDGYAFAFNEDIDEVVIENGVKTIESDAFFDCKTLKSVTVPESVKHMEYCGIGIEYDDDEIDEIAIEGFTLYGKKGSTAESYAKENKLKFAESK